MLIRPLDGSPPPTATAAGGPGASPDEPHVGVAASQDTQPPREVVAAAVKQANDQLEAQNRAIEFTIDPDTKSVVVRLIDKQDNQVLRQVPSQEMLEIAKALDQMQGSLLRSQA